MPHSACSIPRRRLARRRKARPSRVRAHTSFLGEWYRFSVQDAQKTHSTDIVRGNRAIKGCAVYSATNGGLLNLEPSFTLEMEHHFPGPIAVGKPSRNVLK